MNYPVKDALELAQDNYKEYSQYIAQGRAYPCILDGAKSSYKRAIYGMWKEAPRSIVKVAELAAYALPYHPHPTSISGVIVQLGDNGNKLKLMKTQGNWGDSSRNIQPSADRYIGGMLSDTALKLLCDGWSIVIILQVRLTIKNLKHFLLLFLYALLTGVQVFLQDYLD